MNVEIRPLTAGEMGQLGELGGYVYGGSFGDGPDNVVATANLPDTGVRKSRFRQKTFDKNLCTLRSLIFF